mmetsp:Transcript_15680/g.33135  ORF Transcript_15680/g.33135 Transcript_15680/m.33135 type:complete len:657 (-) Transcript_15680:192-2162(-)
MKDDISILSEGSRSFFSRATSAPRYRSKSQTRRRSSTQSVTSNSIASSRSRSRTRGGFLRSFRRSTNIEDVSVSDSLCSGLIGDDVDSIGNSIGNSIGGSRRSFTPVNIGGSIKGLTRSKTPAPVPGGVADFNRNFNRTSSDGNRSLNSGPGLSFEDEAARREQRKERVKEKLERYKREQKQLRFSCVALEKQLAQTTEKLKEVDSKAAFKIDALEAELRDTRGGLEQVAKKSTAEVADQGEVIKGLGKKLIRQAHVIKKQKAVVNQYKKKLEALQEEMAMHDVRDSKRADEFCLLKDKYGEVLEQKLHMQKMLQENIEGMMDLKSETERDAKSIRDLEFNLQQKSASLDRVEKEASENKVKYITLERELEEKDIELEDLSEKLKLSEALVEATKKEFQSVKGDVEELRMKCAGLEKTNGGGGGGGGVGLLGSMKEQLKEEEGRGTVAPARQGRSGSILGWNRPRDSMPDVETFDAELEAKDVTIKRLDETVTEQKETILSLKSDMVKMSSTYKQDSYLKRKEIAKLKQMNAEYALKLRALEKAFKSVGGNSSAVTRSTMHGASSSMGRRHSSVVDGGTSLSRHGSSLHSPSSGPLSSKEDMASAVNARLGVAPYEFPSTDQPRQKESQIVVDSNFFDGNETGSEEERKGEFPEEC